MLQPTILSIPMETGVVLFRGNRNGNGISKKEKKMATDSNTTSRREFGYHDVKSSHMATSEDGYVARKKDPEATYAYGVCFGARRLRGDAEFEVMLTDLGTTWSGTFKLGVMRISSNIQLRHSKIPRYSPDAPSFCVWCNQKLHNRLSGLSGECDSEERPYGLISLDNLKCGDRLGMQLTREGDLSFYVNGCFQGVATRNVYLSGYDVYAVVDHYGRCKATTITRSGLCLTFIIHFHTHTHIHTHTHTHTHTH